MVENSGKEGRRNRLAAVAAGFTIVIVFVGLVAGASPPEPRLAPTTPRRLVSSAAEALLGRETVSGWVETRVDLGLPDVAEASSGGGPLSFAGDHRLRVWHSPRGLRITDVLPLAERSLVVGPDGAWTWDSEAFTARRLAGGEITEAAGGLGGLLGVLDPTALARASLKAISSTTSVKLGSATTVAGRAAYVLVLEPRSQATLVDRVEIAIDGDARVPLAFEVYGDGLSRPSISARFESVSFERIPESIFEFSPPPGAEVETGPPGWAHGDERGRSQDHFGGPRKPHEGRRSGFDGAKVFGTGWASVVAFPLPDKESSDRAGGGLPSLEAFTPFSGPLFTADLVETSSQRWLVVGAVPLEKLQSVGGRLE